MRVFGQYIEQCSAPFGSCERWSCPRYLSIRVIAVRQESSEISLCSPLSSPLTFILITVPIFTHDSAPVLIFYIACTELRLICVVHLLCCIFPVWSQQLNCKHASLSQLKEPTDFPQRVNIGAVSQNAEHKKADLIYSSELVHYCALDNL